jgi:hypothetical protein
LKKYTIADIACDEVLKLDRRNAKALYRKAVAMLGDNQLENWLYAIVLLEKA